MDGAVIAGAWGQLADGSAAPQGSAATKRRGSVVMWQKAGKTAATVSSMQSQRRAGKFKTTSPLLAKKDVSAATAPVAASPSPRHEGETRMPLQSSARPGYLRVETEERAAADVVSDEAMSSDEEPPQPPQWRVSGKDLLETLAFQSIMAALIICNALIIGVETDYPHWESWDDVENAFLAVFLIETAFRILIFTPQQYFDYKSSEFHWNMFDFVVVGFGVVDVASDLVSPAMLRGETLELFRMV